MELNIPAIEGIGGSRLYLVDRYGDNTIYDIDFVFEPEWQAQAGKLDTGLTYIDHLTHNVHQGNMSVWAEFYERLFNFREIRFFDIEGKTTGLFSKAMTSPCGKLRIPLNESQDDHSQIEEYLRDYKGEGIQHIALGTDDIYTTVDQLTTNGVDLQDTNDAYYDQVDDRVPGHGEQLEELRKRRILVDGAPEDDQGLLLQIFTKNVIGPIFFEIIQRKGNEGFGEGNFKALFESLELDQIRRGVITDPSTSS
jgi:4-hydroxyphenylpyruvate dioxygenase